MKKVLTNYRIFQDTMVVYCDNSSAIDISKNPIQHSKTKHIEIRYHFIRDLVERKIVCLEYIPTECQNADIFTKPLDRSKFETLCQVIGVILCPDLSWLFLVLVLYCFSFVTIVLCSLVFVFFSFVSRSCIAFHSKFFLFQKRGGGRKEGKRKHIVFLHYSLCF